MVFASSIRILVWEIYLRISRLRIMVNKTETIKLVAKGNMRIILSFLKTRSPGNLNSGIFGNNKKIDPVMTKTRPRIMKNLAR